MLSVLDVSVVSIVAVIVVAVHAPHASTTLLSSFSRSFFFLSFSCDRTDPHVCSNLRPDAVPIGDADFQTNAAADSRADTASDVAAHPRAYCFTDLCAYGWAHALPELSPDTTAYGRTVARSFTPADS